MKRMLFIFSATVLTVAALVSASIAFPTPAVAGGGRNISGIGYFALPGECTDSQGQGSSYAQLMTGDLVGCLYTFVESAECHPDGLYKETGREVFVAAGRREQHVPHDLRIQGEVRGLPHPGPGDLRVLPPSDYRRERDGYLRGGRRTAGFH